MKGKFRIYIVKFCALHMKRFSYFNSMGSRLSKLRGALKHVVLENGKKHIMKRSTEIINDIQGYYDVAK